MMTALVWTAFSLAAVPAVLFLVNHPFYRRLPGAMPASRPEGVSVLVPARDEESAIGECIASVCGQKHIDLELLVGDDHSTDRTATIVAERAAKDPRVRLVPIPPLPEGWCGKQHACAVLATHARHDVLVFLDADVRLEPEGLARLRDAAGRRPEALLSGFPRQLTGTFAERLVLPLMHFLLLGYLPMAFLRLSKHPAFGAGCGQLFVSRREAYEEAGGHAAIRASRHDGITLPRAYRRAGLPTSLCDATDLARCRMYRSGKEVWNGLAKNATEGLASPRAIVPWSVLLLGGHVLPFALLAAATLGVPAGGVEPILLGAVTSSYLPRCIACVRFRQSPLGAILHPLGIAVLVALQWFAFVRERAGRPASWKGRSYETARTSGPAEDDP